VLPRSGAGSGAANVEVNINSPQYWYRYSDGQWTRQVVPSPRTYNDTMFGLTWVPRTTSLWSVGEADLNYGNASVAVITRYDG
jgi:hypothetical protein